MEDKIARRLSKGLIGIVFSCALGAAYKMNKRIDEKIDEHYDRKKEPPRID